MKFFGFFFLAVLAVFPASAQEAPPARIAIDHIFEKTLAPTTALVGAVDFDKSAGISAEIRGLIARLSVREGAIVKDGDTLAVLNSDFVEKDLQRIRREIERVDVRIAQTEKDLKRFEALFQQEAASEKQYDDLVFELQALKSEQASLRVSREKTALELAKSTVSAPFDGLVLERFVAEGEWIEPGMPICRLASVEDIVVSVSVSEGLVRFVAPENPISVSIAAISREMTGRIKAVVPLVDPKSKTFRLKVRIPYVSGLLQNMSAVANVPSGRERTLKMIRRDALVRQNGKTFIYTVNNNQAKIVPIRVAAVDGEFLGIDESKVAAGMPVVVDGNERLRPGQTVEVFEANQ